MKKALKIIGIVAAVLVVLLLVAFLYVSNGAFIKRHVLPRVATTLGTPVTAEDASFSAFSHIALKGLVVGKADDPLLNAQTVDVTYRFMPLLSGKVVVDKVLLDGVLIDIRQDKLPIFAESTTPVDPNAAPAKAPQVDISNVQLRSVTIKMHQPEYLATPADIAKNIQSTPAKDFAVEGLTLDIPHLANGQSFELTMKSALAAKVGTALDSRVEGFSGTIKGSLDQALQPVSLDADILLTTFAGTGAGVPLAGRQMQVGLKGGVTGPGVFRLDQLRVAELLKGQMELELFASGSLSSTVSDLKIKMDVQSADPLNAIGGAIAGLHFGRTTVHYDGTARMVTTPAAKEGDEPIVTIASKGALTLKDLTVANPTQGLAPLAPVDVHVEHDAVYDLAGPVQLNKLLVTVDQQNRHLVTVNLDSPLFYNLATPTQVTSTNAAGGAGEVSKLTVSADHFPLALVAPLVPPSTDLAILGGMLDSDLVLDVTGGGKAVHVEGSVLVSDLSLKQAGNTYSGLVVRNDLDVTVQEMTRLTVDTATLRLMQQVGASTVSILEAGVKGALDQTTGTGKLNLSVTVNGAAAVNLARPIVGDLDVANTAMTYAGEIAMLAKDKIAVNGDLTVNQLSMSSASRSLPAMLPMNVKAHHELTYTLGDTPQLALNALNADVSDSERRLVNLQLDQPAIINLDPAGVKAPALLGATSLKLKIDRFPVVLATPFIPADKGITLHNGDLNVDFTIDATDEGKAIGVSGNMVLVGLSLEKDNQIVSGIALRNILAIKIHDMTRLEVNTANIRVAQQTGDAVAVIFDADAKGTLDSATGTGSLAVKVIANGKSAIAIAKPFVGDLEVGDTTAAYDGTITMLAKDKVAVNGDFAVNQFTVTSASRNLPVMAPMNVKAHHELTLVSGEVMQVDLQALDADVSDATRRLANLKLDQPATLVLGEKPELAGNTALRLTLDRFPVVLAKPFVPATAELDLRGGDVDLTMNAVASENGKVVRLTGTSTLRDFAATSKGTAIDGIGATNTWDLTITDLNAVAIAAVDGALTVKGANGQPQNVATWKPSGNLTIEPLAGQLKLDATLLGANAGPLIKPFAGDLDLGKTLVSLHVESAFADGGDRLDVRGDLGVADFTVASVSRGIPSVAPMQIAMNFDAGLVASAKRLGLRAFTTQVKEGAAVLLDARLTKPSVLDLNALSQPEAPLPDLPLTLTITNLDLKRFTPFLSPEGSLRSVAGMVNGKADLLSTPEGATINANFNLKNLELTGVNGPQFTEPLTVDLNLASSADASRMLTLKDVTTKVAGASGKSLLDLNVTGNFDLAMQARKSELFITSKNPIDAMALQKLLPEAPAATATTPAPTPAPTSTPAPGADSTTEAPAGLPPMWVITTVNLPKVLYGDVLITDFKSRSELKDNLLTIDPSSFAINGGTGTFAGNVNLADMEVPVYASKVNLLNVPIQPFVSTFLSTWQLTMEGGLNSLAIDISGKGKDPQIAMKSLKGPVAMQLDTLKLTGVRGNLGQIVAQSLQVFYGIGFEDLVFTKGGFDGNVADGTFTLANLLFAGPSVQLDGKGTYTFVGEKAAYNLNFTPYLSKAIYNRVPSYVKDTLTATADGTMYRGQSYPVTSSGKSGYDLAADFAKKIAIEQGKKQLEKVLPPEAKGVLDILKGGGTPATAPADGGGTTQAPATGGLGDLLKGLGGGGQTTTPAPAPAPAPAEGEAAPAPAPAPTPAPAPNLNDLFKGFGGKK